eukprot:1145836-Pelagomonas_calceolata.AAC.27
MQGDIIQGGGDYALDPPSGLGQLPAGRALQLPAPLHQQQGCWMGLPLRLAARSAARRHHARGVMTCALGQESVSRRAHLHTRNVYVFTLNDQHVRCAKDMLGGSIKQMDTGWIGRGVEPALRCASLPATEAVQNPYTRTHRPAYVSTGGLALHPAATHTLHITILHQAVNKLVHTMPSFRPKAHSPQPSRGHLLEHRLATNETGTLTCTTSSATHPSVLPSLLPPGQGLMPSALAHGAQGIAQACTFICLLLRIRAWQVSGAAAVGGGRQRHTIETCACKCTCCMCLGCVCGGGMKAHASALA